MEEKMDEKEMLISIYQNTQTAMQSINDLLSKTNDKEFKELLNAQFKRYEAHSNKTLDYAKSKNIELKDNNWFEKAKLWSSIQMGTLTDSSTRHLAELMLVGSVMGTITCYKTRADQTDTSKDALALLDELEKMEEDNYDELKKYLKDSKK